MPMMHTRARQHPPLWLISTGEVANPHMASPQHQLQVTTIQERVPDIVFRVRDRSCSSLPGGRSCSNFPPHHPQCAMLHVMLDANNKSRVRQGSNSTSRLFVVELRGDFAIGAERCKLVACLLMAGVFLDPNFP